MEGVTDPTFRGLVLARHGPAQLGGAFTEFVRVLDRPRSRAELARHVGPQRFPMPVGVQLMGSDLTALAGTARNALELGVPLVDLNFGCPARGALRGCAGSALLRDAAQLERVVRCVTDAVDGRVPVSAKLRAGYDHARDVETLARAAEQGGAALVTIHCRTRAEGYRPELDWTRIARAVSAVAVPVCGNGGVARHADLARMRRETGCAYVMVGRGALGDPWIFSGAAVARDAAARFLLEYDAAMRASGAPPRGALARLKQLLRTWHAGGLVAGDADRAAWLREQEPEVVLQRLAAAVRCAAPSR
jgi:tRNA-dihydrouridine synthase C